MAGIRLHHPKLRSCTYMLWEPGHRDPTAQGGWRRPKLRPLLIDENGDTIVSKTVWDRLQAAVAAGRIVQEFMFLNDVASPPNLIVGNRSPTITPMYERQVSDAIRQIAPGVSSFSISSSTKYRGDAAFMKPRNRPNA